VAKDQIPASGAGLLPGREQEPDPGGVEERDPAQVKNDPLGAGPELLHRAAGDAGRCNV
jgi:hypothetical protein